MKQQPNNETCRTTGPTATLHLLAATVALGAMLACPAMADNLTPPTTQGGIRVSPVIVGAPVVNGSNATLQIEGLQAPYMIQVSSNGTDWMNGGVTSLKHPNFSGTATATNVPADTAFFRLMMLGSTNWVGKWNPGALGTSNVFVGAGKCLGCHSEKVNEWSGTGHATALSRIMDTNSGAFIGFASASCVPCHTVGNGQPGGFLSVTNTPLLANVQCENCHGSANAHVNISGRTYHPINSLSSATCGACHTGSHHPTFDEWETSGHAEVTADVAFGSSGMTNAGTTGWSRQMSCGFCHSGATRMAMLYDFDLRKKGITNALALPVGLEAGETGVTCAVCHDPHSDANTAQLRNPTRSTNFYTTYTGSRTVATSYFTNMFGVKSTNWTYHNDGFASQYDPNVQICAQCHNSRGARWDGRSLAWVAASNAMVLTTNQSWTRGPHHSPQYNLLVGILQNDYLNTNTLGVATNFLQRHGTSAGSSGAFNTNQCITCHVVSYAVTSSTNVTGHSFAVNTLGCTVAGCHGSVPSIEEEQANTTNAVKRVTSLLSQWAIAKGTNIFGAVNAAKYKENGWEYGTLGALATVTNAGPGASDQPKIPDAIKQARFNTYMVVNDGSLGVHNPRYTTYLLNDAETKVLSQFTLANFKANVASGFAPLTVAFTNLGVGVTSYGWNFGDGNNSTASAPTNVYALPGVYTVGLGASDGVTSESVTRPNYITVVEKPVVSFTGGPVSGQLPLTVTFTNTSTSVSGVTAWRYTFKGGVSGSPTLTVTDTALVSYTYTNAGTFNVILRASTPAGNVSVTNTAYITVTP